MSRQATPAREIPDVSRGAAQDPGRFVGVDKVIQGSVLRALLLTNRSDVRASV